MLGHLPCLKLSNITFSYPRAVTPLFKNVSLSVEKNEIVALLGPSGIGKSSLIRICFGMLPLGCSLSGSVRYEGKELLGISEIQWNQYRGTYLGWMTQAVATALPPDVASKNQLISVLCRRCSYSNQKAHDKLYSELETLGVNYPDLLLNQRWNTLSGGQQRLVLLSLWLSIGSKLLFLDEPSVGLDAVYRCKLAKRLRNESDGTGRSIIIVTHDRNFANETADRKFAFKDGILENTSMFYQNNINNNLNGSIVPEWIVSKRKNHHQVLLRVIDLHKTFWKEHEKCLKVLDGLNFSVWAGGVSLLWGRSGSGKSTAARCALRFQSVDSGKISFMGKDITYSKEDELAPFRKHMQMVEQDAHSTIDPKWTVWKIVSEGTRHFDFNNTDARKRIEKWMGQLGLHLEILERKGSELSIGQAQRVALVRAFAFHPELLVLDEPSANLDAKSRQLLSISIKDYIASGERGILLISHDEDLVRDLKEVVLQRIIIPEKIK